MPPHPIPQLHPPSPIPPILKRRPQPREAIQAAGIAFLLVAVDLPRSDLFCGEVAQCLAVFEMGFGFCGFGVDC